MNSNGSEANPPAFTFDELVEAAQIAGLLAFCADGIAILDTRRAARPSVQSRRAATTCFVNDVVTEVVTKNL